MNETKPSETKSRKMVSRNVAIALGTICIVLVAGLAGTIIVLNNSNQQNTNLQSQVDDLTSTINLTKSEIFYNNVSLPSLGAYEDQSGNEHYQFSLSVLYSGYLGVQVQPFDPHLEVDVSWDYLATYQTTHPFIQYDYQTKHNDSFLSNGTTRYYPVVSAQSPDATTVLVDIVSNSSSLYISANVTITYYY